MLFPVLRTLLLATFGLNVGTAGEPGDRVQFSEFVIANVRLYALRNDFPLSTPAVANFTRNELATALRKVRCCCSRSRSVRLF